MCRCLVELYGDAGWAAGAAPADESAPEADGENEYGSWINVQSVVVFSVLLAVVALGVRYIKGSRDTAAYEKINA